jgi:3-deoxy-D-manno-octulosonic-acid transferase
MQAVVEFILFSIYRWLIIPLVLRVLLIIRFVYQQKSIPLTANSNISKLLQMIQDRDNINMQTLPARPIWIHAASGEIEYAKSIIRLCKERFPQAPILVTYFSPSAKKLIQKFPGVDLVIPLPWDHRQLVKKFLDFYRPRCILIARSDVWPEIAWQCKQNKIPSLLFSATFSKNASERSWLSQAFLRLTLGQMEQIFCVNKIDKDNIEALQLPADIHIGGDTRYDQVLYRKQHPQPMKNNFNKPETEKKIWVLGSTWSEDENVLLPAVQFWLEQGGLVVWAPHEIHSVHIQQLEKQLAHLSLASERYSQITKWDWQNNPILIVDEIGHLHEFYGWGHVAFVGGSFKAKIHSVMEPLSFGLPVLVGPYHLNNREACDFQNVLLTAETSAAMVSHNSDEMIKQLRLIKNISSPHHKILQKVEQCSGASEPVLNFIALNIFHL